MSIEITMPKLGFDMQEGTLISWLKKIGDPIQAGEPIVEVETDKASVEVESFHSGILTHILTEPGQVVKVGTVIGLLDGVGEKMAKPAEVPITRHPPSKSPEDTSSVERMIPQPSTVSSQVGIPARVKISPLARRIARENRIDFLNIQGTGPGGMIIKQDILSRDAERPIQTHLEPMPTLQPEDRRVPLSRMQKVIARRMMQSNTEVPQFTVSISIEMEKALDLRSRYNTIHPEDQQLSINDLIIRGAALVLRKYPRLNSSFREQELEYHSHINIGIAVALDKGLLTVVLRDADQKSLSQLSADTKNLIQRARDDKNRPEDIEGSTFTISNLGMYGIDDFRAIINPPEAAILAVGAVQIQPQFVDGNWIPCRVAKFNLSVDHRVSDGAEAARYLKELKIVLEEPVYLI